MYRLKYDRRKSFSARTNTGRFHLFSLCPPRQCSCPELLTMSFRESKAWWVTRIVWIHCSETVHMISLCLTLLIYLDLSLFLQFFSCYVLAIEYSDHLNVKILSILQSWSFRVQDFKQKTKDLEPHVELVFQILQAVRSPMSSPACAPRNFAHSDSHSAFTSRCLRTSNLNQRAWWRRFVPVAFGNLTK